MKYVGKIDKELFRAITPDIVTDEVVLTDERIEHIKRRHPNDFERYARHIKEIVSEPDFILVANKPNSAVLLKEFVADNERFQLILRLKTSNDPADFKNSIITFMKIDETRYKLYIKSKKVLYKRE